MTCHHCSKPNMRPTGYRDDTTGRYVCYECRGCKQEQWVIWSKRDKPKGKK